MDTCFRRRVAWRCIIRVASLVWIWKRWEGILVRCDRYHGCSSHNARLPYVRYPIYDFGIPISWGPLVIGHLLAQFVAVSNVLINFSVRGDCLPCVAWPRLPLWGVWVVESDRPILNWRAGLIYDPVRLFPDNIGIYAWRKRRPWFNSCFEFLFYCIIQHCQPYLAPTCFFDDVALRFNIRANYIRCLSSGSCQCRPTPIWFFEMAWRLDACFFEMAWRFDGVFEFRYLLSVSPEYAVWRAEYSNRVHQVFDVMALTCPLKYALLDFICFR